MRIIRWVDMWWRGAVRHATTALRRRRSRTDDRDYAYASDTLRLALIGDARATQFLGERSSEAEHHSKHNRRREHRVWRSAERIGQLSSALGALIDLLH